MSTTTVGRYLTQRLEALGVRHVFGVPGDYRDPLLHHKIRSFESQLTIFREVTCAAVSIADQDSAQRDIDRTLAA